MVWNGVNIFSCVLHNSVLDTVFGIIIWSNNLRPKRDIPAGSGGELEHSVTQSGFRWFMAKLKGSLSEVLTSASLLSSSPSFWGSGSK